MEMKNVLKTLRKTRGYTSAKDFCKAIGISFSTYQNYESGSRVPTVEMLVKIADFYGVTTDFLLGREPIPKPIANLNLSEENEIEVIDKYMSLPPEIRVDLMNALAAVRRTISKTLSSACTSRMRPPRPSLSASCFSTSFRRAAS